MILVDILGLSIGISAFLLFRFDRVLVKYYSEAKYFFAVREQMDVLDNSLAESVSATYQVFTLTLKSKREKR